MRQPNLTSFKLAGTQAGLPLRVINAAITPV